MVEGTENLLREGRGKIKRFVYFSSVAALGLGRDIDGLNEDAPRVVCGVPYCDTKGEAEDLVAGFCAEAGIEHVIVRPANVIGPGSVWVTDVLDAYYRGPLPLIDGGRAPGAFVWVTNLADGAIAAAELPAAAGKTYHFRDDYRITWEGYERFLGGLIGKRPAGSLPFSLAWKLGAAPGGAPLAPRHTAAPHPACGRRHGQKPRRGYGAGQKGARLDGQGRRGAGAGRDRAVGEGGLYTGARAETEDRHSRCLRQPGR